MEFVEGGVPGEARRAFDLDAKDVDRAFHPQVAADS